MLQIVLYEPEIPANTGNVIRLAANAGARLHLVRPLGFTLNDKQLVRAGLDYADIATIVVHDDWHACRHDLDANRMFAVTTKGSTRYDAPRYRADDVFVFGPETRGLPQPVRDEFKPAQCIRLPMQAGNRSLNLSNTVAIVLYEAWRQLDFKES